MCLVKYRQNKVKENQNECMYRSYKSYKFIIYVENRYPPWMNNTASKIKERNPENKIAPLVLYNLLGQLVFMRMG